MFVQYPLMCNLMDNYTNDNDRIQEVSDKTNYRGGGF